MQKKPPKGPSPLPHCWCPQLCARLYLPAVNIYKFRDSKGCRVAANFFASYASLHTVLVTLSLSGILSSARLPNTHTHTHIMTYVSLSQYLLTAGFCINDCHRKKTCFSTWKCRSPWNWAPLAPASLCLFRFHIGFEVAQATHHFHVAHLRSKVPWKSLWRPPWHTPRTTKDPSKGSSFIVSWLACW